LFVKGFKGHMTLRQFYRITAGLFLFTIALMVALNVVLAMGGREALESLPFVIRLLLGTFGVLSAIGIIGLWFGMIWNCLVASGLTSQHCGDYPYTTRSEVRGWTA
jgi:hypothetical protein